MSIYIGLEVPIHETNHYKLIHSQLTERFRTLKINGEFVDKATLSITLSFLGHVSEKSMEKLEVLRSFASFYPKQEIIINGLAAVPTWEAARGIWMTCRKTDPLITLQEMVQKTIQREGLPAEMKNFFPRINICRFPGTANIKALFNGIPAMFTVTEIEASNLVIYESDVLNPEKIKPIRSYPLQ